MFDASHLLAFSPPSSSLLMLSLVSVLFSSLLVLAVGTLAEWLRGHTSPVAWQQRITGGVLVAVGVRLAFA